MERERKKRGKNDGRLGKRTSLPLFFPALSLSLFFARVPLSERLEQANVCEARWVLCEMLGRNVPPGHRYIMSETFPYTL